MDILITGGTGFLGRHLARALLERGDRVALWTRDPRQPRAPSGALLVPMGTFPFDPQAVYNLAGEPVGPRRWTPRVRAAIRESRVDGTRRLVSALAQRPRPPRVLVSASAIGFYGGTGVSEPEEDSTPGTDFLAQVCADWEQEALALEGPRTRVALPRIGLVLGRDGGALPKLALPFRFFMGGWPGHGRQVVSWIHLADLVGLLRFALDTEALRGPFNATAPEPVTMASLGRALGQALGRPCWLPLPGLLLRLALGQAASLVLEGRRCLPRRALQAGFAFAYPGLHPALEELLRPEQRA